MSDMPTGTELARPFLPAKDYDVSKRFYERLGFEKVLDGEVAIFNAGSGGFIVQRYYQKDWAENTMMQLMVDDLDAWWRHVVGLDLPQAFGVQSPRAPAMQPWGLRVAYVYDPSGVLWHVSQRREDAPQDATPSKPAPPLVLSMADRSYVAKRERRARHWPWVGTGAVILLALYAGWLWVKTPNLIDPWHVMDALEAGTLPESTMSVMALMLPIVTAALLVFVCVFVLLWFVAFRNERRLIRLIRKLERDAVSRGGTGPGPGSETRSNAP